MASHLVIGASGLVGSAIVDELVARKQKVTRLAQCYRIENEQQISSTVEFVQPDVIWLAAAFSNVSAAQEERKSDEVNITGVNNVVQSAKDFGCRVVFFSSSYVFDGSKETPYEVLDSPNPISLYGAQKVVGERLVEQLAEYTIVRTCGVYGHDVNRKCFPYNVLDNVQYGRKVYAARDQWICPIHARELASLSYAAYKQGNGIYHVNGSEAVSKYEWAEQIAITAGQDNRLIIPTSNDPIRPKNGTLRNSFYTESFAKGMRAFFNDYQATNN